MVWLNLNILKTSVWVDFGSVKEEKIKNPTRLWLPSVYGGAGEQKIQSKLWSTPISGKLKNKGTGSDGSKSQGGKKKKTLIPARVQKLYFYCLEEPFIASKAV
jgi:hypothetical protein